LYGEKHKASLVDVSVLNPYTLLAFFMAIWVNVLEHFINQVILTKDQSFNTHL